MKYLAVLASVAIGLTAGSAAARDLVVVGWGGAHSEAMEKAFNQPFAAANGITIKMENYTGGLAQVMAQVESNNVLWDVLEANPPEAAIGCRDGLLEPFPLDTLPPGSDGTPAAEDFYPGTLHECGVGSAIYSWLVAYDPKHFPDAEPTSVTDLFNPEFQVRRGFLKAARGTLEIALMADGVAKDQIYEVLKTPEGVERALAVLDRVKDLSVWYDTSAQGTQLLADGEVAMIIGHNGRFHQAIEVENQPFKLAWGDQLWTTGMVIIPKGTPLRDLAFDYVRFAQSSEGQAAFTNMMPYAPARRSAMALVDPKMHPYLSTYEPNFATAMRHDTDFWTEYGDAVTEQFNNWLAR